VAIASGACSCPIKRAISISREGSVVRDCTSAGVNSRIGFPCLYMRAELPAGIPLGTRAHHQ
jgi:hypothetical protein